MIYTTILQKQLVCITGLYITFHSTAELLLLFVFALGVEGEKGGVVQLGACVVGAGEAAVYAGGVFVDCGAGAVEAEGALDGSLVLHSRLRREPRGVVCEVGLVGRKSGRKVRREGAGGEKNRR